MRLDQLQLDFDFSNSPGLDRHTVVIAYDTPSNRRRRKLARVALSYADRVQRSVYEASLTDAQLRVLVRSLGSVADLGADDIRLFPQCTRCAALSLRLGKARPPAAPCLVVA
jgi:CRISPR-associated protein Cas2